MENSYVRARTPSQTLSLDSPDNDGTTLYIKTSNSSLLEFMSMSQLQNISFCLYQVHCRSDDTPGKSASMVTQRFKHLQVIIFGSSFQGTQLGRKIAWDLRLCFGVPQRNRTSEMCVSIGKDVL